MSAVLPWLGVGVPLAGALAIWVLRRGAGWGAVGAAGLTLLLVLAGVRGAPLALGLAVLAAGAALLVARPGMAAGAAVRLLAMLGGLELAAVGAGVLGWVGLAGAVLAAVPAGGLAWRALRAVVPALGLGLAGMVLAGMVLGEGSAGRATLGYALVLAGLVGCAGLVPLQGWRRMVGGGAAAAMLPVLGAVALGMLLRARAGLAPVAELDPGMPLLAVGLASLGWAAVGLWRGRVGEAGLFHAGLACCAFGLGGPQADAAGLMLLAVAGLAIPALPAAGVGRAVLLWLLALLPPFAPFGAGLALIGAAADASLGLAVVLAGLATVGAAGLGRMALRAGAGQLTVPAAVVGVLGLLAGVVPAVARWFDLMAGVVR